MKKYFWTITLSLIFTISFPQTTKAGEGALFFSSAHGVYQSGTEFKTRLMINSGGGPGINAAEAKIKFDPKKINVKSIDKTGSIFDFWTQAPTFDNKTGTISFGGGSPKAYKDGAGLVFNVNFSLLNKGTTTMKLSTSTSDLLSAELTPKDILKITRDGNITIGTANDVKNSQAFTKKYAGRIVLQVQANGEAWYIYPDDNRKYFLGRPLDAFNIMRKLGLGAKHSFITQNKIFPVKYAGKIIIDVEDSGKAYYIYPVDRKAYYLGRPDDAFKIMREKGLGMTNEMIYKIKDWVI